jgi:hypothetical protein
MGDLPKIEPCPFCLSPRVELHRNFDYVHCLFCGASGHVFDGHPYDAIVTWNSVSLRSQATEAAINKKVEADMLRKRRASAMCAVFKLLYGGKSHAGNIAD